MVVVLTSIMETPSEKAPQQNQRYNGDTIFLEIRDGYINGLIHQGCYFVDGAHCESPSPMKIVVPVDESKGHSVDVD